MILGLGKQGPGEVDDRSRRPRGTMSVVVGEKG